MILNSEIQCNLSVFVYLQPLRVSNTRIWTTQSNAGTTNFSGQVLSEGSTVRSLMDSNPRLLQEQSGGARIPGLLDSNPRLLQEQSGGARIPSLLDSNSRLLPGQAGGAQIPSLMAPNRLNMQNNYKDQDSRYSNRPRSYYMWQGLGLTYSDMTGSSVCKYSLLLILYMCKMVITANIFSFVVFVFESFLLSKLLMHWMFKITLLNNGCKKMDRFLSVLIL